jgi:hypothetical protein
MMFKTSSAQAATIPLIAGEMRNRHFSEDVVLQAAGLAYFDQGIYDLLEQWYNEALSGNTQEAYLSYKEIISSIQDYNFTTGRVQRLNNG